MAHFSVMHREPLRNNFSPSRRHNRHTGPRYLATALPPVTERCISVVHLFAAKLTLLYTLRRLGGRQPLCGIGVTSRIKLIRRPAACKDRMADSRPDPGPFTYTSIWRIPLSIALRAAASPARCAAKGVLLREPL